MNNNYLILVLAFVCFYMGCSQFQKDQLVGHWKGIKVLEQGNDMKLNPDDIAFFFDKNGQYSYTGTIGYKEAGSYFLEGDLLLSKDTIQKNSKEKAVKILKLQKDSLVLEMLASGKEQTVYLVKN